MSTIDDESFWRTQLGGLDFSGLPDAPESKPEEPQAEESRALTTGSERQLITPTNGFLVMAILSSVMGWLREHPMQTHSAMVVIRMADGNFRFVYPSIYNRETVDDLSEAASNFRLVSGFDLPNEED